MSFSACALRRFVFAATAVASLSCGGDSTGPINKNLALAISEYPTPQKDTVAPGDSIRLSLIASGPRSPIIYTVVRVSGTIDSVDSVPEGRVPEVRRDVMVRIPMRATLRSSFTISVKTGNASGEVVTKTLPEFTILDPDARPFVSGSLTSVHAGGAQVGDTLTLTVLASDRGKLSYVGYRFGPPANIADSVLASRSADTLVRQIAVGSSWAGVSTYSAFARDSAGNSVEYPIGVLTVATRARRPIASVALPGQLFDAVLDQKRNAVYMSVPDAHEVAILSLTTMTFEAPLSFDAMPQGLDLTSGGDTLAVALLQDQKVALIDLRSGATVETIAMPTGAEPINLRVSSEDKIVVATQGGSGLGGALVEADPVTGTSRTLAAATAYTALAASGNRARIMALLNNDCCPVTSLIYDSSLRALTLRGGAGDFDGYIPSSDYGGDRFLIGNRIFTAALVEHETYTGLFDEGRSVLANDGKSGYFADETQVYHARLSDSAILDTFELGEHAQSMWLSRDGLTLLVPGGNHLFIVDLW